MLMNQKTNKKQNETPNSLFLKLKQALNAQRHNLRLQQKNILKRSHQNFFQDRKENSLSCSLQLNDAILQNLQQPPSGLSLALNTSKMALNPKSPLTPYQTRKSIVSDKLRKSNPKKQGIFELRKKVYPQSTKMLQVKQQRVKKFFKQQRPKTQATQNEQSLTYSMILKSFTNQESVLGSQKQPIKNQQVSEQNQLSEKCGRCSFHNQQRTAMFFKNEEIKKNIQIIEGMKKAFDDKNNETEFKHFPEVQVLNLSYFNENKKKIVSKIQSRQGPYSLQRMKLFSSKRKFSEIQCSKCKQIEKHIEQQRKGKQLSNLITYPNSFQYFVYEYKPTGHSTKKNQRSHNIASQSNLYLKKNRINKSNINNQKASSSIKGFNNAFQDFIMHNKIDMPPRPQTAAPIKTSQEIFHYRISHPCPTQQNYHHKVIPKIPNEENFVKPWDNTGPEVDNEF